MEQEQEVSNRKKNHVSTWVSRVKRAKGYWKKKAFDRMNRDIQFAEGIQWEGQVQIDDERYIANVIQRHIHTAVAALYAKNPTATAKKRETIDFKIWDGESESILAAITNVMQSQQVFSETGQVMPVSPNDIDLVEDFNAGEEHRAMIKRIGKSMEVSWHHAINQQIPTFKDSLKDLVTEVVTAGVGYVKVGYRRTGEVSPEDADKAVNHAERMRHLMSVLEKTEKDSFDDDSAEAAEVEMLLEDTEEQQVQYDDEGLVYDFPTSDSIIPDTRCKRLVGFYGANWVAQEHKMDADEIQEIYGVDITDGEGAVEHIQETTESKDIIPPPSGGEAAEVDGVNSEKSVFEIWDKRTRMTFTIVEGYSDYLVNPHSPVFGVEGFWPVRALTFNKLTSRKSIFPSSDVTLLRPMQLEYNRSREGLREHRIANRPRHLTRVGALDDDAKSQFEDPTPHQVIEVKSVDDQPLGNLVIPFTSVPIDASVYETNSIKDDMLMVGALQEADLGGIDDSSTATGQSIAEGNRMASLQSRIDDMDSFLTWVTRISGALLLEHQSLERTKQIAGMGAIWPQLSRAEIQRELFLEVRTGSSGRPNKAMQISVLERLTPLLVQLPTINPEWLAKQAIEALDASVDPTEAIASGIPSILSMNSMAGQPSTGDPASDPNAQGQKGGDNSPTKKSGEGSQAGSVTTAAPQAAPVG